MKLAATLVSLAALALAAPALAAAAPLRAGACAPAVERLQTELGELGFPSGGADGCFGPRTRYAVQAFQKAARLRADGVVGVRTANALRAAARPRPHRRGRGLHAEVDLERQLLLLVRNGKVGSAYSVSTGRAGFDTPTGTYRVQRKERRSWSVPYRVWLPYASYFVGGYAFHAGAVPARPASHGCVRVPPPFAAEIFAALKVGTPVHVYNGAT